MGSIRSNDSCSCVKLRRVERVLDQNCSFRANSTFDGGSEGVGGMTVENGAVSGGGISIPFEWSANRDLDVLSSKCLASNDGRRGGS